METLYRTCDRWIYASRMRLSLIVHRQLHANRMRSKRKEAGKGNRPARDSEMIEVENFQERENETSEIIRCPK
jgi:hypothetical protein